MKSSFLHFIIAVIIGGAVFAGYGAWYKVVTNESTSVANLQSQISAKTKAAKTPLPRVRRLLKSQAVRMHYKVILSHKPVWSASLMVSKRKGRHWERP